MGKRGQERGRRKGRGVYHAMQSGSEGVRGSEGSDLFTYDAQDEVLTWTSRFVLPD